MKKSILSYLKHLGLTILVLFVVAIIAGLYLGATVHYGDNPLLVNLDGEGPFVFYHQDSLMTLNYIRGDKTSGFYLEQEDFPVDSTIRATCHFPLDSTAFNFELTANFEIPEDTYQDDHPILAVSDIEGGYQAFRDFLIHSRVIDEALNWTFGKGHLVLVGDFVDRGASVTQVLWLIYKLEKEAAKQGGVVHYILGNHELKNMQGHFDAAEPKYFAIAAILGKQHQELYDTNAFIGRWMASKNTVEIINGNLFAHGGIHPEVAATDLTLTEINQIVRKNYYQCYYPKTEKTTAQLLTSNRTGIAWYRGYFKEDLTQDQIDGVLHHFQAKAIIVGHTLQSKINRQYDGKVIGIDVKHPKDYQRNWPKGNSEGLLINDGKYYRVFDNGEKKEI